MIDPIFYESLTFQQASNSAAKSIISEIERNSKIFAQTGLFLSGGSTPKELYDNLTKGLNLDKIDLYQVDERWVSSKSERSNQKMIKAIFEEKLSSFHPIGTLDEFQNPLQAAQEYESKLHRLLNNQPFLIGIFGMGEDGHTASLFPGVYDPNVSHYLTHYFVPIHKEHRLTITPAFINKMHVRILLITGSHKGSVLGRALASRDFESFPVLTLFESSCQLYLDKTAMNACEKTRNE